MLFSMNYHVWVLFHISFFLNPMKLKHSQITFYFVALWRVSLGLNRCKRWYKGGPKHGQSNNTLPVLSFWDFLLKLQIMPGWNGDSMSHFEQPTHTVGFDIFLSFWWARGYHWKLLLQCLKELMYLPEMISTPPRSSLYIRRIWLSLLVKCTSATRQLLIKGDFSDSAL